MWVKAWLGTGGPMNLLCGWDRFMWVYRKWLVSVSNKKFGFDVMVFDWVNDSIDRTINDAFGCCYFCRFVNEFHTALGWVYGKRGHFCRLFLFLHGSVIAVALESMSTFIGANRALAARTVSITVKMSFFFIGAKKKRARVVAWLQR